MYNVHILSYENKYSQYMSMNDIYESYELHSKITLMRSVDFITLRGPVGHKVRMEKTLFLNLSNSA